MESNFELTSWKFKCVERCRFAFSFLKSKRNVVAHGYWGGLMNELFEDVNTFCSRRLFLISSSDSTLASAWLRRLSLYSLRGILGLELKTVVVFGGKGGVEGSYCFLLLVQSLLDVFSSSDEVLFGFAGAK